MKSLYFKAREIIRFSPIIGSVVYLAQSARYSNRGEFRRRVVELRQADRAHQDGVSFTRELLGFSRKRAACLVDRDAAQKPFGQLQRMPEFRRHSLQNIYGRTRDFGADSVAG